ncbi:MAG TPA: hypothetical protein DDX19_06565 [Rhodopirellula baltica]|nr:hypothetical protein [Rhodopirellula baltica]
MISRTALAAVNRMPTEADAHWLLTPTG